MNTPYSVKESYALGDKYFRANKYWAAEVCYALPEMDDHSENTSQCEDINPQKLRDLKRKSYGNPPKGTNINQQLLSLIKSFYKPWLKEIVKPAMIVCEH